MEVKIKVDDALANYLEQLDYEQSSLRMLLMDAAERNLNNTSAFDSWELKYKDAFAAFQIGKAEFEKTQVLPKANGRPCTWKLDYGTCELSIVFGGENEKAE